ncbi:hypothetical protein [Frigoriglobus tundricola]|uniref:Uncharacterized protein n=1 Tax=Frigoriglobus tundricola TaxID=2774151 RepID=A0A6M5YZ45_9BACT|nr:hypothetical protein [Frigoriglobus tundricola]QJW98511.1 hypothetical protein FTUN_6101 [Frigoriglobus tundricola]
MSSPLRPKTLLTLQLAETARAVETAAGAPPMFLGDEELERRRAAVEQALDALDARVLAGVQNNRGVYRTQLLILGVLAIAVVAATVYAIAREALVAGGVAGVGTLATAAWFIPQYRALKRERMYLETLVPGWRAVVAAATTEAGLQKAAADIVAAMRQLDAGN